MHGHCTPHWPLCQVSRGGWHGGQGLAAGITFWPQTARETCVRRAPDGRDALPYSTLLLAARRLHACTNAACWGVVWMI